MFGDNAVGKTSIITQYIEKKFEDDYKMTIGIDISAKLLQIDEKNVCLFIWDIGGQKQYKIIHKSYLKGAFGAILVYDCTNKNSFNHVFDWVEECGRFYGDIPLILAGNKIDLTDEKVVSAEEGAKLAKEIKADFFETSAKTGKNINKIFTSLVKL